MEAIKLCRLDTPIIFIEARINLSRFVVTGCAAKTSATVTFPKIGRAVQQECRDRSRMPSSAWKIEVYVFDALIVFLKDLRYRRHVLKAQSLLSCRIRL